MKENFRDFLKKDKISFDELKKIFSGECENMKEDGLFENYIEVDNEHEKSLKEEKEKVNKKIIEILAENKNARENQVTNKASDLLTEQNENNIPVSNISFLGTLDLAPKKPKAGTMYRNATNGIVFIHDGTSFQQLVKDGMGGGPGSGVGVPEARRIANEEIAKSPGMGQNNTASNVGDANPIFKQKSGFDLEFRTLSAGPGIDITSATNIITIKTDIFSSTTAGIISGGIVTVNTSDNTKFDVSEGLGTVVDYTDINNPIIKKIKFGSFISQSIPDISTPFSLVFIDKDGNLMAQSGEIETSEIRKTHIALQGITHVAGTVIESITNRTLPAIDYAKSLGDVLVETPPINRGNDFSATGANLQIQKTSGTTFRAHINYRTDPLNPSRFLDPFLSATPIIRHRRDGSGGHIFDTIFFEVDPNNFDDGTSALATVPPNKFQIQIIWWVPEAQVAVISYGQMIYNSLSEARDDVPYQILDIEQTLATTTSPRNVLLIKEGVTSLLDTANASLLPNRVNFSC